MSASGSTPFLHNDRRPSVYGEAFAKELGIDPNLDPSELAERFREIPAKVIIEKSTMFKDWDVTNPLPWKPVVDANSPRPFLPATFTQLVEKGHFDTSIPILTGLNSEEGLILSAPFHKSPKRWDLLFRQWDVWAPQLFFNRETDLVDEADRSCVRQVREKFFPDSTGKSGEVSLIPPFNDANLRRLEQLFTLAIFLAPLQKDIKLLHSKGAKIYR